MEKFSHAGVSRFKGEFKVRFANDQIRVKVLAKNGHKDIDIIELREPMTKADAVAFLLSIDFDNGNKEVRAALEAAAEKRGVDLAKVKAKIKKVKPKVVEVEDEAEVPETEPAAEDLAVPKDKEEAAA